MAEAAHITFSFKAKPEFAGIVDRLAERRGVGRSAFIRALVAEEAIRLAAGSGSMEAA